MPTINNELFQKLQLSGGTGDGRRIKVAATADPGTIIHTGPGDAAVTDEIWLDAYNSSDAAVILYIEWGGNTSPDDIFKKNIPPQDGLQWVVPGNVLAGAATPLVVRAYADTADVITIGGFVNRIE